MLAVDVIDHISREKEAIKFDLLPIIKFIFEKGLLNDTHKTTVYCLPNADQKKRFNSIMVTREENIAHKYVEKKHDLIEIVQMIFDIFDACDTQSIKSVHKHTQTDGFLQSFLM